MLPLPHTRECEHEGIPVFLFGCFSCSDSPARKRSSAADGSASPAQLPSRGFFLPLFFFWFSDELPDFNPEK